MMKRIHVFDPPLCCNTGVCGPEVDQQLVTFAGDAAWAVGQGVAIERFNLAQQPVEFASRPLVREFLEGAGPEALPLVLVDDVVAMSGRYPTRVELAAWAGIAPPLPRASGRALPLAPVEGPDDCC
jgi:hypothetical protein